MNFYVNVVSAHQHHITYNSTQLVDDNSSMFFLFSFFLYAESDRWDILKLVRENCFHASGDFDISLWYYHFFFLFWYRSEISEERCEKKGKKLRISNGSIKATRNLSLPSLSPAPTKLWYAKFWISFFMSMHMYDVVFHTNIIEMENISCTPIENRPKGVLDCFPLEYLSNIQMIFK